MLSSFPAPFDAPPTRSPAPMPLPQTPDWYERQQETNGPTAIVFAQGYPYEQVRPNRDFTPQLQSLEQHYTLLDSNHLMIEYLADEPPVYALLIEAVRPLQNAFGKGRIIQLRIQDSGDDSLLKVAVQLPARFGNDPTRV